MLIIDCGSGFTRAKIFWRSADGLVCWRPAVDSEGLRWKQRRLVDVLIEGGATVREWVIGVQALIELSGAESAIMGATGGLREAEADGRVTPAHMEDLLVALQELAPTIQFRCLSGDEEACTELRAVQHVAEIALPPEAPRPIGMLSGGGMTCQLAYYLTPNEPSFVSIVAAINDATSHMSQAASARDSLAQYQAHMAKQLAATGLKGQAGAGTFVVIEMPGALGSASGFGGCFSSLAEKIGQRLLQPDALAAHLRAHLEEWAQATPGRLAEDVPSSYIATQPAELLELLDLFDDSARLYVCDEWPCAAGEGEATIKPDWSLGMFLAAALLDGEAQPQDKAAL